MKVITTLDYNNEKIEITKRDLWLIKTIREMGFGKLSEVEIQNGLVVMIRKWEKKIKPPEEVDENVNAKTS